MNAATKFSSLGRPFATVALMATLAGLALLAGAGAKDEPKAPSSPAPAAQAAGPTSGTTPSPCLIVKHKGTIGRRLIFTALIGVPIAPGAKYDLVSAVNYRAQKMAYTGKGLEKLQAAGVRVTVLEKKYTQQDLDAARNSCSQETTPKP